MHWLMGFGKEPQELKTQLCANCKREQALLGVPSDRLLQLRVPEGALEGAQGGVQASSPTI